MKQELTIKSTLQPPPTKTEVIDALLQLSFQKWSVEKKEILAKKKVLEERLTKTAFKISRTVSFENADTEVVSYGIAPYVRVCFDVHDVALNNDLAAFKELEKSDTHWDEKKERLAIRNAMNGVQAGRVEAMLADEATKKKLLTLGSEIGVL